MFAVVVRETGDAAQIDGSGSMVSERVAPRVRQAPGFVSALWMSDGAGGTLNVMVFSSAEAARAGAEAARAAPRRAATTVHERGVRRDAQRTRKRIGDGRPAGCGVLAGLRPTDHWEDGVQEVQREPQAARRAVGNAASLLPDRVNRTGDDRLDVGTARRAAVRKCPSSTIRTSVDPSYQLLVFQFVTGDLIGVQHLLRPDIYLQGTPPCPQQPNGAYVYIPRNDTWSCLRST